MRGKRFLKSSRNPTRPCGRGVSRSFCARRTPPSITTMNCVPAWGIWNSSIAACAGRPRHRTPWRSGLLNSRHWHRGGNRSKLNATNSVALSPKLEWRIATLRGEIDQETESATQALIESGGDAPGASDALVKRRQDLKLLAEAVAKVRQQEAALESEWGEHSYSGTESAAVHRIRPSIGGRDRPSRTVAGIHPGDRPGRREQGTYPRWQPPHLRNPDSGRRYSGRHGIARRRDHLGLIQADGRESLA